MSISRALVTLLLVPASAAALAQDAARKEIDSQLAAIAAASGGTLGVSAIDLKTGERVRFNADQPFPMASTFKVPVAIKVLEQVERGALRLDEPVAIDTGNLSPGTGELVGAPPGKSATIGELVKLMLRDSDNTATDLLLARIGGPSSVTAHMKALGITRLQVDRPAAQLVADAWGFKLPPPGSRTSQALKRAQGTVPADRRAQAIRTFLEDPRDTTTPDAMAAVLERLQGGKALGRKGTEILIDHMESCRTGPRRLKGEMPRGTVVAHKTGTLSRVATNDVGIVPLGWSSGTMVIAVYLKGSDQPLAAQERTIAQAGLAAYRYFTR